MYKFSIHSRAKGSSEKYESYVADYFKIDAISNGSLVYKNSYYNYTYDEFLKDQMRRNPQTDSYGGGWKSARAEDVSRYLNPENALQFKDDDNEIENNIKLTINTSALNVRNLPSVDGSRVIDVVYKGHEYKVLDISSSGWYKISTGKCTGWVSGHYVKTKVNAQSKTKNLDAVEIRTSILNVRRGASTNYPVITQVRSGEIYVVQGIKNGWYKISANGRTGWISSKYAKSTNQAPKDMYQFLVLSGSSDIDKNDLNSVLVGKGILANQAQAFIRASQIHDVNEIYLLSHALLETGNGSSTLARGVLVDMVDGKKVTPRVVYNMYGIGAYDSSPIRSGSERAYKLGWFTPEASIIGGAEFISNQYVNNSSHKQDTLYKMRWNPASPGNHQYATDIGWAHKQINRIKQLYDQCSNFVLKFDIPKFL